MNRANLLNISVNQLTSYFRRWLGTFASTRYFLKLAKPSNLLGQRFDTHYHRLSIYERQETYSNFLTAAKAVS